MTKPYFYNLPQIMAHNHIHLSFPQKLWRSARELMLEEVSVEPERAVVVVIGAGASTNAVGLPLGDTTRKILRERLNVPLEFLQDELERLSIQYRLEPNEFETELLALSRFRRNQLKDELGKIFFRRFYVSSAYEILAHLLKHRFIDGIINFNFDELLDQAIDDEIGNENYHRVVFDGDMPGNLSKFQNQTKRFLLPLYVKPHGTASHKSSLRFTREAYFLIPDNLRDLLQKMLSNIPTTLILIGFAMQSVEFNHIVQEAAKTTSLEVIVVNPSDDVIARIPDKDIKISYIPFSKEPGELGVLLSELWKQICKEFNKTMQPRGINRHQLISSIFSEKLNFEHSENERQNLPDYLKDRTIIETALAVAKARGFVNIGQLANSRVGRYFQHYREYIAKETETLHSLCEQLSLTTVGYSHDTLRVSVDGMAPESNADKNLIIEHEAWEKYKNNLIHECLEVLSPFRQEVFQNSNCIELFKETLDYMYSHDEVEVSSPRESPYQLHFKKPLALGSMAATKIQTRQILDSNWDHLLCVAESGKWLLEDDIKELILKNHERRISAIVADSIHIDDLKKFYKSKGLKIKVYPIPWWLHNQHMTLVIQNSKPKYGVYFERRLRSLAISPVKLDEVNDLKIALDAFIAYWIKAKQFKHEKNVENTFIHAKQIENKRKKLLG